MAKFLPRRTEKEVISLRISSDVVQEIDKRAGKIDISRNELINLMIAYALENWEQE